MVRGLGVIPGPLAYWGLMTVSVLIPAFNRPQFIGETLKSVLASDYPDLEVIVRNSSDPEYRDEVNRIVLQYPQVKLFQGVNKGVSHSGNELAKLATGEYLIYVSDDDLIAPDAIRRLVDLLQTCDLAGTQVAFIDKDSNPHTEDHFWKHVKQATNQDSEGWRQMLFNGTPFFSAVMCRKEFRMSIKSEEDEIYEQLPDLAFYMRCLDHGGIIKVIEEPLYKLRIHGGNMSYPTEEHGLRHEKEINLLRKKYYYKKTKVTIATPFYEIKGYAPYITALFQTVYTLARHSTLDFTFYELSGGSYPDNNRNIMANEFLGTDSTHLLFIDSDHSWDVMGFLRLLKADVDLVGAAYPVKNNWVNYGVTIHTNDDNTPIVNKDGLILADKVPTGFMKIHRRVFEAIRDANPDDWYFHSDGKTKLYNFFGHITENHVRYGEDISFGIRWQRTGGKVWVEPRVSIGHYGVQGWHGNYDQFLREQNGGDLDPARGLDELLSKAA